MILHVVAFGGSTITSGTAFPVTRYLFSWNVMRGSGDAWLVGGHNDDKTRFSPENLSTLNLEDLMRAIVPGFQNIYIPLP